MPKLRPSLIGVSVLLVLAAIAAVQLVVLKRAPQTPPLSELHATVFQTARPVADFALVDHHGQAFSRARLRGKWSFLFFGYTNCPDVCPTTLTVLNLVDQQLAARPALRDAAQFVFVSVDPERDSVAQLDKYVPYFNKAFIGVTETMPGQLLALTRPLGILHMRATEPSAEDGYLVDHTASVLLVNPRAELQAIFSAPHDAVTMATEFGKIYDYFAGRS